MVGVEAKLKQPIIVAFSVTWTGFASGHFTYDIIESGKYGNTCRQNQ
jgi:hypothetical protein